MLLVITERNQIMFCKKCGQEMLNSAKFCPKCGTPTPVMPHQETSFEQNPTTFNNIPGKTSSTLGTAIAIPRQFFFKKDNYGYNFIDCGNFTDIFSNIIFNK